MPTTYTPPIAQRVTPRTLLHSTNRQKRLYRYMRPLDVAVNTFLLSDGTVVTDYPVLLSNGQQSSTAIPYPWNPTASRALPPDGTESGPTGTPPPYATVINWDRTVQQFTESVYIVSWFKGAHGPYSGLSAAVITQLTNAHFDNYLS